MRYLVDAARMKAIDEYTSNVIGIPSLVLMEKAAMAVVELMKSKIKKNDKVIAVCGTGNNGGDGIAIARILTQLGYYTDVLILGDENRATDQTKQQLIIARNIGVKVMNLTDFSSTSSSQNTCGVDLNNINLEEYTVVVDAMFGIGLSKPITGVFQQVIDLVNAYSNTIFSVDIPSGIQADSGKVMNVAIQADYTITFGVNKIGLVLYPGCEYAGEIYVKDIGFPKQAIEMVKPYVFSYEKTDRDLLPFRKNYSNKGTYGKVLIIAGSRNMSGACYLSAKAACRSGAGLVKVLTAHENRTCIQTLLPEAILSTYEQNDLKNKFEIDRIIHELEWASAIVIGPGIGISQASDHLLEIVLKHAKVPIVVDADALTMLAGKTQYIVKDHEKEMYSDIELPENVIITPHLKEMSRLLDCDVKSIQDDFLAVGVNTVKGKNFVLVMKDARTLVSDGERCYINQSGNNGMATAGVGDVLTGIIAAFVAQGLECFDAATLGVYVHGLAGDKAVEGKSRYSLIASDIIEALPLVLHE